MILFGRPIIFRCLLSDEWPVNNSVTSAYLFLSNASESLDSFYKSFDWQERESHSQTTKKKAPTSFFMALGGAYAAYCQL
jgi:hypothetical protein